MIRSLAGSTIYLVKLTMRRQFFSRKTAMVLLTFAILAALVTLLGLIRPWKVETFGRWVVLEVIGNFFVPLTALAYGTGALGDDRDDRSLVYLLVRPIPRPAIYLGKLFAVAALATLFNIGGFGALCGLAGISMGEGSIEVFRAVAPAFLLSTAAYLALFQLLGAAFRHSTVIALLYVFFVEMFLSHVPGIMKRASIQFFQRCLAYSGTRPLGIDLRPREAKVYVPVDGDTAMWVLLLLTVFLIFLGTAIFTLKEHRDSA